MSDTNTKPALTQDQKIQAATDKLARLVAGKALNVAKASPELAELVALDETARDAITSAGTALNGADARRISHELWIQEINATEAYNFAEREQNHIRRQEISAFMAAWADADAEDREDPATFADALNRQMVSNLFALSANLDQAIAARESHTAKKRAPKKAAPVSAAADA